MQKLKKLSIRPYLNTKLAATGTHVDLDGTETPLYQLYYLISYDRGNNYIKSHFASHYGYKSLKDVESSSPGLINFESDLVRKIVEMDTDGFREKYDLKGIKQKFEIYSTSVSYTIDHYMRRKLWLAAATTNSDFFGVLTIDNYSMNVSFKTVLDACRRLFDDFDNLLDEQTELKLAACLEYFELFWVDSFSQGYTFATILDWVTGDHQKALRLKLAKKMDQDEINKVVDQVNEIILERLKQLPAG